MFHGICLPQVKLENTELWSNNLVIFHLDEFSVPVILALIILAVHSTRHLSPQVPTAAVFVHEGVGKN